MWDYTKNILEIEGGNYRSILGYAGESLAIGRALVCGYNLFFKAWRDAKYDAVLDANGVLFRIEIKQTSGDKNLTVSSGGRAGQQINREAGSREQVLSKADCDFVLGVHSMSGFCWIIPTEVIEIIGRKSLNNLILGPFREKWKIFIINYPPLPAFRIRDGFSMLAIEEIEKIATGLGIVEGDNYDIQMSSRTKMTLGRKDWLVIKIWQKLYERI